MTSTLSAAPTVEQERDHYAHQLACQHLEYARESEQLSRKIKALEGNIAELQTRAKTCCTPCAKFWFVTASVAMTVLAVIGYQAYKIYNDPFGETLEAFSMSADLAESSLRLRISDIARPFWHW